MISGKISDKRASRMLSLIEEIYPLPRMVNSPGLDKTFEIIKRELPDIVLHEYPSGFEYEDWVVPCKWSVKQGFMKDRHGSIIASIDETHLFVAPYSEPVDGWFSKEEISKHLSVRPDRPDSFAFEHRNAYDYQLVDWGITLPYSRWVNLPDGKYHIKIETDCSAGSMKAGEYFLKGKRPETVCICAHIDELCNDDLSGCVVAIELMRYLESIPERQYSYQMLLTPEMFGTLFFAYKNPEKVRNTIAMLNLETLGAGDEWCLKKARTKDVYIERVLRTAMKKTGVSFKELDFFRGYGNDERVYAWPGINIPGVSLQRYPFKEYHTSDDTPAVIKSRYLNEALEICKTFIQILENDWVPGYTNRLQPCLSRRRLYFDSIKEPENFQKYNNILLFNVNGSHSILDLAEISSLDFFDIHKYMHQFAEAGLVEGSEVNLKHCNNGERPHD